MRLELEIMAILLQNGRVTMARKEIAYLQSKLNLAQLYLSEMHKEVLWQ